MNTIAQSSNVDTFASAGWRRSAACGPDLGNCVEVGWSTQGHVGVRDSKMAAAQRCGSAGPAAILSFSRHAWRGFVRHYPDGIVNHS